MNVHIRTFVDNFVLLIIWEKLENGLPSKAPSEQVYFAIVKATRYTGIRGVTSNWVVVKFVVLTKNVQAELTE